ncbi:MAG TPA: cytochrome c biogenesis protein CcdA [Vicinamibacterales bacterium]|nr:cytochrome c biogenesis protein CcdA [Vicinamibacterales bacterium]
MVENVSALAAFVAGLLSFVSPCVLPLIPGYLSFVSGVTLDQMMGTPGGSAGTAVAVAAPGATVVRRRVLLTAAAFVLGFSMVFIALGATATALGQFFFERLDLLGKIAGVVIIVFGLHTMGLLKIGWLYSEKRVQVERRPAGMLGAFLVGVSFAFGWTPCIGPILSGILAIAAVQETVGQGIQLLAIYSAGLGVPFLLTALAVDRFFTAFARIRRHYRTIEIVSGALLVLIGVLIFTDRFTIIARWLEPYLPTL